MDEEDVMKAIPGLTIMGASPTNHTGITDAGPPVDSVVLLAWAAASVVSYVVFGVVRPYAIRKETASVPSPPVSSSTQAGAVADLSSVRRERRYHAWVVRQLFCCAWSWLLVDIVYRVLCYVFLPPTMLWRRQMLPLPQATLFGYGEWFNKARLLFLCGPHRARNHGENAFSYFVLGGYFRDVIELTSDDAGLNPKLAEWIMDCQKRHHWRLPVTGVRSSHQSAAWERENAKMRHYRSDTQQQHEVEFYHLLVLATVLVAFVVVVSVIHLLVTRLVPIVQGLLSRMDSDDGDSSQGSESGSDRDLAEEEINDRGLDSAAPNIGDADDSWVGSPEARAEEARLRALERKKCSEQRHARGTQSGALAVSGMTLTIEECWPTLLGCVYAGMFAYVGGLPIMMQFLFPGMIVIASILAMVFAA